MSEHNNKTNGANDTTSPNPENKEVVSKSTRDIALNYAHEHGFAVLPCVPGGKEPAIAGGYQSATNDPEKIGRGFKENSNIGIRTGSQGGVFVLDIDTPGGHESLSILMMLYDDLPETVMATTPSGGMHYYFKSPDEFEVKRLIGKIGEKIDILGEGSYVVAPPSSLPNGNYAWVPGFGPGEIEVAEAPEWLLRKIEEYQTRAPAQVATSLDESEEEEIIEGERNDTLTSLAGSMRSRGMGKDAILSALLIHNQEKCQPPLPDKEVEGIVQSVCRYKPGKSRAPAKPILPYQEFPVDALPAPLNEFVYSGSDSIGCDASYLALPLLAGLASAIGNSYEIELKSDWKEPSILWTGIVGDSGTMKSPALKQALEPVREQQKTAADISVLDQDEYKRDSLRYEEKMKRWKRGTMSEDPPEEPSEPIVLRTYTEDVTIEALASLLAKQPNGMLVTFDELASLFSSFDRYSGSGGGDASRWLSLYGAGPLAIDRKGSGPKEITISRASVGVTGGIQPGVLRRTLSKKYRENGLAARFLLALPPYKVPMWSERVIDPVCKEKVRQVYQRLYQFGFQEGGTFRTEALRLSPDAKDAWIEFHDRHGIEMSDLSGDLKAAYSKLRGCAARLALILHLSGCAARIDLDPGAISLDSMQRGIRLIEWFKYETCRVYAILASEEDQDEHIKYVEKIREKGGKTTPSQFSRMFASHWETQDGPEKTLEDLKQRGLGHWENARPGPKGGRPTRIFVLDE